MTKQKSTKRALLSSAIALLVCVAMLIGTTFAWFTDSVTSGSNVIKSGKLEVALLDANGDSLEGEMIEWAARDGRSQDEILWEPGCTYNTEPFTVKNVGNLNLKFRLFVNGINGDAKLLEVIDFSCIVKNYTYEVVLGGFGISNTADIDLLKGLDMNGTVYNEFMLKPGESMENIVLTGHMDELAGNEYQNLKIENISISVIATQAIGEEDSFDGTYDELATYNGLSTGTLEDGQSAISIPVTDGTDTKVGFADIPAGALADGKTTSDAEIRPVEYKGNFTVDTGMIAKSFNISISNLKENNDVPVKVQIYVGKGMDPTTFKMYHYSDEIACTYDPYDGYVTFESATFSPFTIVYDADSEYVAPEAKPEGLPVADVAPYVLEEPIEWGQYGQWSPTEGLEANLDAIYKFSCTESYEEAQANAFANWECDFFVKLDRDLGENEIFLGGNYGDFGWVGFHNGDVTLEANEEIPLLGSVTNGAWTYAEVVSFVGEFICGVGNVGDSLEGATFTVMLRLTNPENANEFYNVATINYTF